jgi:alcohol dehydrogenase YqhD (iron-dependent ADH family)
MQEFLFHNPTRIIFGAGKTDQIGEVTSPHGKRVMLLYGQNSARESGLVERVNTSLTEQGITVVERGGVQPNPVLLFVRETINIFRTEKLDAIVAVGGGSVIDTAKAVAAGVSYRGDVWDFFCGKAVVKEACPLTVVLTLAATGSEMNSGCVITNEETRQKFAASGPSLYPRASILDPENTFGVPMDHSMYGAVDAIVHVQEGYFNCSTGPHPIQERFIEGLIGGIIEAADAIRIDPRDYNARASLMWAATLALNGIAHAGLGTTGWPMHMIEHSLSALYDIAHGAGLAIVGLAWMRDQSRRDPALFSQFGERVFGITGGDETQVADGGIFALENWYRQIGCPVRLGDVGIPADDIPAIADNAVMLAKRWGMRKYDTERIAGILRLAVD